MDSNISRIGFWAGLLAATATIGFVIVQILQLNRVLLFPADEIWIFGTSLCIVIPFLLEMVAFHVCTSPGKKFYSLAALVFTSMYAVFVTTNYVVQLATVIPAKVAGIPYDKILEQTPHSLMWNFDALGYIFMGLATGIAIPACRRQGFGKWVRLALLANAAVTPLIAVVYFSPVFSEQLLMLGFPWGITAPMAMLMMAFGFRNTCGSTATQINKSVNL